jgi:hypothetical protein
VKVEVAREVENSLDRRSDEGLESDAAHARLLGKGKGRGNATRQSGGSLSDREPFITLLA